MPIADIAIGFVILLFVLFLILSFHCLMKLFRFFPAMSEGLDNKSLKEAEILSDTLLRECLTEEEYQELKTLGYLEVKSPSIPWMKYRIPRHPGVVKVYEGDQYLAILCVQPEGILPFGDRVLMHKFHIEGNEARYLRTAGRLGGRLPRD